MKKRKNETKKTFADLSISTLRSTAFYENASEILLVFELFQARIWAFFQLILYMDNFK